MPPIKDRSTAHSTTLETIVAVGRRQIPVSVSVVGRDLWAYQMAKIKLQDKVIAERRANHR